MVAGAVVVAVVAVPVGCVVAVPVGCVVGLGSTTLKFAVWVVPVSTD